MYHICIYFTGVYAVVLFHVSLPHLVLFFSFRISALLRETNIHHSTINACKHTQTKVVSHIQMFLRPFMIYYIQSHTSICHYTKYFSAVYLNGIQKQGDMLEKYIIIAVKCIIHVRIQTE